MPSMSRLSRPVLSNFKHAVIYFFVSARVLPPPQSTLYLALSKNIGKNNTTHKFVVKATYIESTGLPCSLVKRLGLHVIHDLLEVR
jgi:hypothetical protein